MIVMPLLGLNEAVIVGAAILFLILGPKKLPQFARSIGESRKEFKQSMEEVEEIEEDVEELKEG